MAAGLTLVGAPPILLAMVFMPRDIYRPVRGASQHLASFGRHDVGQAGAGPRFSPLARWFWNR